MTIYCCAGPMKNFHCDACGRDASPGERQVEALSDEEWNAYAEAAGIVGQVNSGLTVTAETYRGAVTIEPNQDGTYNNELNKSLTALHSLLPSHLLKDEE